MEIAVQKHLDNKAQELGYDDMNSTAKYLRASSPHCAECETLGTWLDLVWAKAWSIQEGIVEWDDAVPTIEEVLQQLPTYEAE